MRSSSWLGFVAIVVVNACGAQWTSTDQIATVAPVVFDAERAHKDVARQVQFGPRIPGTDGHRRTLSWLRDTLTPLADELHEDHFEKIGLPLVNVVARFRPEKEARILIAAHWDTRPRADQDRDPKRRSAPVPGANDGGSGVAILVELARMLARQPPPIGVDLVFFDGEDYGNFSAGTMLLGSQHYAANPMLPLPRFGILLDMVGDSDLCLKREMYSDDCCRSVVDEVWGTAAALGHGEVFLDERGPAILDDHVPLILAGIPMIDIIDLDYPWWHTTGDRPERTSAKSLRAVGETVAAVIYHQKD